jgi:HK97 family phage major capsid protein
MNSEELRRELEQARTNRERLFAEVENLQARADEEGIAQRISETNRAIEKADGRIADMEAQFGRYAYAERQAQDTRNFDGYQAKQEQAEQRDTGPRSETRDQALRTIERLADRMDTGKAEEVETLVRQDRQGDMLARYLTAVGDENYRSAFGKIVQDPQHGHLRFSAAEVEAVRATSQIEQERALNIGTGSAGGFALPFTLDPSIILSSTGALNPIRRLAKVVTTTTNSWLGVSSDGVTASYSAEGSAMVDGSPTLAQPSILCRRWTVFIPYSWELAGDWAGLESELARLSADARDVLESQVFYSGTVSLNQPQGITTGLSSSNVVLTAGTATLAAGDLWNLKAQIPPRFQSGAAISAPSPQFDRVFRLVGNGATAEASLFESNNRSGNLVGLPTAEWSFNAGTATATGSTIALAGDFSSGYVIADRLGLSAVPIQSLFSGNTAGGISYPTGQSGLAIWGRTGAGVVNQNALRLLVGR